MKIDKNLQRISGVYMIEVDSDKKIYRYVGSSKNVYQRLHKHMSELRKNRHQNVIMQNLYNKYGFEKFGYTLLETCNPKELVFREQFFINSNSPEINITKEVIRNNLTEESKEKIRETLKRKHLSGELSHSGSEKVPVKVYDMEGNYLQTLSSISEVSRIYFVPHGKVSLVCNGKRKSANGLQFRFLNDECNGNVFPRNFFKKNKIKVTIEETGEEINLQVGIYNLYNFLKGNLYNNPNLTYKITTVPVKSDELLEKPEEVNQQPSLELNAL